MIDLYLIDREWECWQKVVAEMRRAGLDTGGKVTCLIAAVQLWGETLHWLRSMQSLEQRETALRYYTEQIARLDTHTTRTLPHDLNKNDGLNTGGL